MFYIFKLIIFIVSLIAISNSQPMDNFPLKNSTWVVAEGQNKRIYPSVLPLVPEKLCFISFPKDFSDKISVIKIWWKNFRLKDYWGTAEVVAEAENQYPDNTFISVLITDVNKGKGIDIAYQPYKDTLWSLHRAILEAFTANKFDYCELVQGSVKKVYDNSGGDYTSVNTLKEESNQSGSYTKEKPTAWIRRKKSSEDVKTFTMQVTNPENPTNNYYYKQTTQDVKKSTVKMSDNSTQVLKTIGNIDSDNNGINEYCDNDYYFKKVSDYDFHIDKLGYWQVHIYPEIWYYPRDFTTGDPIIHNDLKVIRDSAMARKKRSLDNSKDNNLKYWRDPFYSDSASTVISFSFTEDGTNLNNKDFIWLSGSAINSKMDFEHYPPKMFNVKNDLSKSLYRLYSINEAEDAFATTLDERCGSKWKKDDESNGKDIFPLLKRSEGNYKRDWDANDGIYMYNDCPCSKDPRLGGKTKAQIRTFVLKPLPTCRYEDMGYALNFYKRMLQVLDSPQDQSILNQKINDLSAVMNSREKIYNQYFNDHFRKDHKFLYKDKSDMYSNYFLPREKACPGTWVSVLQQLGL